MSFFNPNTQKTMQLLVKNEPIETNGKSFSNYTDDDSNSSFHDTLRKNNKRNKSFSISFKKDKDSIISKLRNDLHKERILNKKFTSDIASLIVEIKVNKQVEQKLLNTIEKYKVEVDLLRTNLNSCKSLSDNLVKVQQEFIAFNQKCSINNANNTSLNCIDSNPLPRTELSEITNTNDSTNNESTFGVNSSSMMASSSKNVMKKKLNPKQNQPQNDENQKSIDQKPRNFIETFDDSTDNDLTDTETDSLPTKETNFTNDKELIKNEPHVEMSKTLNKSNKTINFQIRSRTVRQIKTNEKFKVDLPFSSIEPFSSLTFGYISKEKMNEKQKLAHARLSTHLLELFIIKINRRMTLCHFYKSKKGYRMEMKCTKHTCNLILIIHFNNKNQRAFGFYKGKCDHYYEGSLSQNSRLADGETVDNSLSEGNDLSQASHLNESNQTANEVNDSIEAQMNRNKVKKRRGRPIQIVHKRRLN